MGETNEESNFRLVFRFASIRFRNDNKLIVFFVILSVWYWLASTCLLTYISCIRSVVEALSIHSLHRSNCSLIHYFFSAVFSSDCNKSQRIYHKSNPFTNRSLCTGGHCCTVNRHCCSLSEMFLLGAIIVIVIVRAYN